jgi:hypothetical protein
MLQAKQLGPTEGGSLGWAWTQILPSPHARSPPRRLQVGRALGTRPVLTAPPTARRRQRSRPQPPKSEATPVQLPYRTHRRVVGRRQPLATHCRPSPSGRWPVCPIFSIRVPGVLPVICLSLTFHRATEAVAKKPEQKAGENSQMISDRLFSLKTRKTSWKPAQFPLCLGLIGPCSSRVSNRTGLEALSDIKSYQSIAA